MTAPKTIQTLRLAMAWVMLCCTALAQTGPKIQFEKLTHDFAEINQGDVVNVNFTFTNPGDAPLEILKVSTSCGCTTAVPEKKTYAPGETGTIPVIFNSGHFEGKITKRITIDTNDIASPKTVVTIKANILVDVNANPATVFFQNAELGKMNLEEIQVSTTRLEKLEITELAIEPEFLTAELVVVDEKNAKIIIKADGNLMPKGTSRLNGYLTYTTNSPRQARMRAAITVNVLQPIRANPRAVYFYASKAGQKRDMSLTLTGTNEKPFKVMEIQSDKPFLSVSLLKEDAGVQHYRVSLSPTAPQGKFQGKITFKTDMPGQEELIVEVKGSVGP